MSRRTLAVLVIGWLLGITTAIMVPTLVYQRQSMLLSGNDGAERLRQATSDGWVVTRQDGSVWTFERPRFRIP